MIHLLKCKHFSTNKGLISKIYKQLVQLNDKQKKHNPMKTQWKNAQKHLNRHFSKGDIKIGQKTHEKQLNTSNY